MKIIPLLVLFFGFAAAQAQINSSSIQLNSKTRLTAVIETFDPSKHKIDTCRDALLNRYICRIDGNKWYGTDQGIELPRNQLKKLTIHFKGKDILLETACMFNPTFSSELKSGQFKFKRDGRLYFLYGFFSDGAGTYTAHWRIWNGKSTRIKISGDENDFSWQFD